MPVHLFSTKWNNDEQAFSDNYNFPYCNMQQYMGTNLVYGKWIGHKDRQEEY